VTAPAGYRSPPPFIGPSALEQRAAEARRLAASLTFADPQIQGFVIAASGMAEEDPRIADQIDHNAVDQFLASPDLRETLTDAAVLNEGAFGKLTGALTGENERADELIRLIGGYLYQARRLRMSDETPMEVTEAQ
jgi:type I restriction enzyme, R subunit